MLVGATMVMVSIALLMAVVVTNVYFKKDQTAKCPRWLKGLVSCCSRKPARKHDPYVEHLTSKGRLIDGDLDLQDLANNEGDVFVYHCNSKQNHVPNCTHEARSGSGESEDWMMAGYALDRLFFWLFCFLSLLTLGAILWQIRGLFQRPDRPSELVR